MSSAESSEKLEKLVFASNVSPSRSTETNSLLLADSIRSFAGALSRAPVWYFVPEYGEHLSSDAKERLIALGVTLIPFDMDPEVARFPFTSEAQAAALAESMALGDVDLLAWLNPNTLILREPGEFIIPEGKIMGYRPVHHINVGSRFNDPIDPFWTQVYRLCDVPEDTVFPMKTHVDNETIRPYFNAGFHVTRPKGGLLQAWRDTFLGVYRRPELQELYQEDRRYAIFIHQAILSGIILSTLAYDEIQELPKEYNYPLHLHGEDVTDYRPNYMEELVAIRHEGFHTDPDWMEKMPAREPLKRWIAERLLR
ncbi:MAG: hypothetical protein ACETVY_07070 [Candidatus Bathyarchaeia archaeon]